MVTVEVINKTITYMDGTNIDTVVTEYETVTKNITLPANQTVVTTTPVFTWVPVAGTTVTLAVGPTYVAYTNIWGGLEKPWPTELNAEELEPSFTDELSPVETGGLILESSFPEEPEPPEETCDARIREIPVWPTKSKDYQYFIVTYTGSAPGFVRSDVPISLPPALLEHLKAEPAITSVFNGSDIATCTLRSTRGQTRTFSGTVTPPGGTSTPPAEESPPPMVIPTTSSYISEVYQTTSAQITVQGCLRCVKPPETPTREGPGSQDHIVPPSRTPVNPPEPPASKVRPPPEPPVSKEPPPPATPPPDNDHPTQVQPQSPRPERPSNNDRQSITVGDSVFQVRPAQPTQAPNTQKHPDPNRSQENQQPSQNANPNIVLGTDTLTPGQTTTINGVQVVVPSNTGNGNTNIIVNGQTIPVTPLPTAGPPVLTVGSNTLTANPQGQFIVGTQTLVPGGTPVTIDGSTLSLGPSDTIVIVNGVTQTLGNAPVFTNFNAPILTVGGQTIPATVVGGTTAFVLAPDQTLTPGGALIVSGMTFSMPPSGSGSTILVNGVPSVLPTAQPGAAPVLTLGSQTLTATLLSGTPAFVLGPDQTLTPGGALTVSGTTFSLPSSGAGSLVVINGQTSTFGISPLITDAPALTIDGTTIAPTVRDGTTEYVIAPGVTLKPGEVVTVRGITYSLDESGTALVVHGSTSAVARTTGPARNSGSTTGSGSSSAGKSAQSTVTRSSSTKSTTSTTSTVRDPGDFIASGVGVTKKTGGAGSLQARGTGNLERWVEGALIGLLGWMVMLF